MVSSNNIAILILAAGASSRMGKITKQLLPWENTTLLGKTIRTAKACTADSITLVVGAKATSIRKSVSQENIQIIENTEWKSGLGSSIACGTKFLLKTNPLINAILVVLADQPLIDSLYLNKVITTFNSEGKGVATAYKNKAGVPALFPKAYFEKLVTLHDDFGAKGIINDIKESFAVLQPGYKTIDIDTKSDYENLINSCK